MKLITTDRYIESQADVGILGDQYFIRHALSKRNRIIPSKDKDFAFDEIVKQAADTFNISIEAIFTSR